MSEFKTIQMPSEDADPINIEDERFGSVEILGTEGVADDQGGRKPGGVVNGSVKEVKKAETGPLYMSDSRPRVCQGPMSSPSRLTSMKIQVSKCATFLQMRRWIYLFVMFL